MAQAKQGDTVKVHYTGTLDNGEVFDTSVNGDPLEFTLGEGKIIPGFEEAVVGMVAGETRTIQIAPEQAYGPHLAELELVVERSKLPSDLDPEVGQRLQVNPQGGQPLVVTVTDVTDSQVKLDANHPLAGKELTFEIQLMELA